MLAFASVWISLASLLIAVAMLVYRPVMTDIAITIVLYFGSPGAMCFGGLVLWANRKEKMPEPGIIAQRVQCKVAITMAIVAAAIVYGLIIGSDKLVPVET
jgi:hypothetical protein